MTFREWKVEVDLELEALVGMSSEDIPDWDYYAAWRDSQEPLAAAFEVLVEAGLDFEGRD
jgi:hypothetical protein